MNGITPTLPPPAAASGLGVRDQRLHDLRESSEQLVASAFVQTLLDASQHSRLKGAVGHGGRGEEVFAEQMNIILAERIAASPRLGVAEAVYERLAQRYLGLGGSRPQAGVVG